MTSIPKSSTDSMAQKAVEHIVQFDRVQTRRPEKRQ